MINEDDVIFREVQMFQDWLRLLLVVSMVIAFGFAGFALWQLLSKQGPVEVLPVIVLVVAGIGVPIAIAVLFYTLKLKTEVRTDGLYVRFYPFHIHYKKFAAEDLAECYSRTYRPLREYGGWGIRCGFGKTGSAYNVSGNKGAQLVFKNGKRLLIGSQKADELADAVNSILKGQ